MSYKLPNTKHGLDPFHVLSAMQKFIRRNKEREAFEMACELMHTSKAYHTMCLTRLQIIAHEDIDCLSQPHIVPFVRASCELSKELWDDNKPGKRRLPIANVIMMLSRATKSRQADHFNGAVGIVNEVSLSEPEVPEWSLDHHTSIGKAKGRGMKYFREVSTKLVPPAKPDDYEDEFYEAQAAKAAKIGGKPSGKAAAAPKLSLTKRRALTKR